jgi:hypothetical protein
VLELLPLATLRITISQHTRLDRIPIGSRLVGEASACDGDGRITGRQAGACTDWLTLNADGTVGVAWVNTIQAVGKGIRTDTSLVYELYELR